MTPIYTIDVQPLHFTHMMSQTLADEEERDVWLTESEDEEVN